MDQRFTVYLQLSICGLSMARPRSLLISIFFLGYTGDGDALLSPSPSTGRKASERRGDPFSPIRKVRNNGVSEFTPHQLCCGMQLCMFANLLMGQNWDRSTSSIDSRVIKVHVQTIRMLPLDCSVCSICTVLCGNSSFSRCS